jgi:hypothetical protein
MRTRVSRVVLSIALGMLGLGVQAGPASAHPGLHTSSTTVSCSPAAVVVGQSTNCTATVMDTSPPGPNFHSPTGIVTWASNGPGTFSSMTCTLPMVGMGRTKSCSVTYTPTAVGTGSHTITATYPGDANHTGSFGTFVVTVTAPAPHTTSTSVSCTPSTYQAGGSTTCTATVTDTSASATTPQGTVSWSSSPTSIAFAPNPCILSGGTGASNSCMVTFSETKADTYTITATYGGDPTHSGSSGTATVTVTPGDPASLTLAPSPGHSAVNEVNSTHCETATVKDLFGNPTPNITVIFSVTGVNPGGGSDTTDANGEAEFCYIGLLFGPDAIHAFADFDPEDGSQDAGEPFGDAAKVWTLPPSTPLCAVEFPTGGGHFHADNGDFANFGGNAHVSETGDPTGQQQYRDHGPVQPLDVHSINVLAVVCIAVDGGKQATLYGEATIDGSGTHPYRIQVEDLSEGGSSDTYWILLTLYNSGRHTLEGGNITIH